MSPAQSPRSTKISIYFDCICGATCAIIAITGIIVTTILKGIFNPFWYALGLGFWIVWLCLSIFLIAVGLYTRKKEKEYLRTQGISV